MELTFRKRTKSVQKAYVKMYSILDAFKMYVFCTFINFYKKMYVFCTFNDHLIVFFRTKNVQNAYKKRIFVFFKFIYF